MRDEHFGLQIATYNDVTDYAVFYNFDNQGTMLAKIEYGNKATYLEPGEKATIKVRNSDIMISQDSLPRVTMINRGNPDA